ncbi:MAG: SRPBCC domain-containing protein [Acidimicrobiales bacterium]
MAEHGELHFARVFDAPRSLVFACMTDPDHLTHFWGPAGVRAPRDRITVDARPGGVFETVMVNEADGSEYPTRAVYDEVRPPELLVWTESHTGMRVRTEFVTLGPDRTEVRIHQTYVPEAFSVPEAQAGFRSSLDRFAAYLAGLAA